MTASAEALRLYKLGLLCMCGHVCIWHEPRWDRWASPEDRRKFGKDVLVKKGFFSKCVAYKCKCAEFEHVKDNLKLCEVLHKGVKNEIYG